MRQKSSSARAGRPHISQHKRKHLIDLYQTSAGKRSLRSLALECGMAASTAGRILEQAGLQKPAPQSTSPATEPSQAGTRVSLRTVAAAAGVSLSTASLALKGSPKISAATTKRVERTARELDYQVHPYVGAQLAAVRRGKVRKIQASLAYLFAHPSRKISWQQALQQPFGPRRLFESAKKAAQKSGYQLEPFDFADSALSSQRLRQILDARGIRGILIDMAPYIALHKPFPFHHFAHVSFQDHNEFRTHVLGHDFFLNTLIQYCQLWLLGYRRIGFVMSDAVSVSSLFRRDAAFHHAQYHLTPEALRVPLLHAESLAEHLVQGVFAGKALRERNRADETHWLLSHDWDDFRHLNQKEIITPLLQRWIQDFKPDAIICEHYDLKERLESIGYRVPQDIALSHGNLNADVAGWSGIRRADETIAEAAVEHLVHRIDLGKFGDPKVPIHQRYPGQWIAGKTTRRIRKPASPLTTAADRWIQRVMNEPLVL